MRSMKLLSSVLCMQIAASAVACWAAQAGSSAPGQQPAGVLLPPAVEISSPFAMNAQASERVNAIAFLSQKMMTAQDRQIVQDASRTIDQMAALRGFDMKQGDWNYQQIACPIFPEQVLLFYTRDNGVGDVSEFTAILPRSGKQPVRILPILRRSFSLFDPAPVNAITIAIFNAVRAEQHPARKVDWLTTGLCYAALSGVNVQVAPVRQKGMPNISLAPNSLLQIEADGTASVRFLDVGNPQRVMSWDLGFDRGGKLLRVAVTPVPALETKVVP